MPLAVLQLLKLRIAHIADVHFALPTNGGARREHYGGFGHDGPVTEAVAAGEGAANTEQVSARDSGFDRSALVLGGRREREGGRKGARREAGAVAYYPRLQSTNVRSVVGGVVEGMRRRAWRPSWGRGVGLSSDHLFILGNIVMYRNTKEVRIVTLHISTRLQRFFPLGVPCFGVPSRFPFRCLARDRRCWRARSELTALLQPNL